MKTINFSNYKRGTLTKVTTTSEVKVKKGFTHNKLIKKSRYVARLGINYDNLQQTIANRYTGEAPKENNGLSWANWINPFMLEHKTTGQKYLRVYANKGQCKSTYYLNGKKVDKAAIENMLYAKSSSDAHNGILTLNIKLDNIKSVSQKNKVFIN